MKGAANSLMRFMILISFYKSIIRELVISIIGKE